MKIRKTLERAGRRFQIAQEQGLRFRVLDESGLVLDEFELVQTAVGWEAFRTTATVDEAVESFASSFAAEVREGTIKI